MKNDRKRKKKQFCPCHYALFLLALCCGLINTLQAQTTDTTYVPNQILVDFDDFTLPENILELQENMEASPMKYYSLLNAYLWTVPDTVFMENDTLIGMREIADYCQNINYVDAADPNYYYYRQAIPNDEHYPLLWGMPKIQAPEAWDIQIGSHTIVVGVIDTGVDWQHEDLADNIFINTGEIANNGIDDDGNGYIDDVRGYDFINRDADPYDDHGHGTHVAGIIAAVGNNSIGVTGVAWTTKILPLKIFNSEGRATSSAILEAIDYANLMEVDITNNSWGGSRYSQTLRNAIQATHESGQLFVAAAGNSGLNNDVNRFFPASYTLPNIISVAATDQDDYLANFSNFGSIQVDLAAPGVGIFSTLPNNEYGYKNGTSMAAPYVAGVVALMMAQCPDLSHLEIKARLLASVDPVPALADKCVSGGRLNAFKAIQPPTATFTHLSNQLTVEFTPEHMDTNAVYIWDFGDGNSSMERMPVHTYATDGTYTLELTVEDACGVDSISQSITVQAANICWVTNRNDSGEGSLREAINCANAHIGPDIIQFNIPENELDTILLTTPLPVLEDSHTVIDGMSQNGEIGAIIIQENGFESYDDIFDIRGDYCEIYGLHLDIKSVWGGTNIWVLADHIIIGGVDKGNIFEVSGAPASGIRLSNQSAVIQGNRFGTVDGLHPTSSSGIRAITVSGSNHLIGGTVTGQQNQFVNCQICVKGSENVAIKGNLFGTDHTGTNKIGAGEIEIRGGAQNLLIGGEEPNAANVIAGNGISTIFTDENNEGLQIIGNHIGVDITGRKRLGSTGIGVHGVKDVFIEKNIIGGTDTGIGLGPNRGTINIVNNFVGTNELGDDLGNSYGIRVTGNNLIHIGDGEATHANTIAYNDYGVYLETERIDSVSISNNSFYCNMEKAISLNHANGGQQPPTIQMVTNAVISGIANPHSKIELFLLDNEDCPDARCQGGTYLGNVITDSQGNWSISDFMQPLSDGDIVTATATYQKNTSEFSICKVVGMPNCSITADFTYSATNLTLNLWDASTSETAILNYSWDFGDGQTSTDANLQYTYLAPGDYTVCLTTYSSCGESTHCEDITIQWEHPNATAFQKAFGGDGHENGQKILEDSDGNYLLLGRSNNSFEQGSYDFYLNKVNTNGLKLSSKIYANPIYHIFEEGFVATEDNGFLLLGTDNNRNEQDINLHLLKIDEEGNLVWSKAYTSLTGNIGNKQIIALDNQHYLLKDGSWLTKINHLGEVQWSYDYNYRHPNSSGGLGINQVLKMSNGKLMLIGNAASENVTNSLPYISQIDQDGNVLWSKIFQTNNAWDVVQLRDIIEDKVNQTFYVTGYFWNWQEAISSRVLVFQINEQGEILWSKRLGGEQEVINTMIQVDEQHLLLSAYTAKLTNYQASPYLAKITTQGDIVWEKILNTWSFGFKDIMPTSDHHFAFLGDIWYRGAGFSDAFMVKTNADVDLGCQEEYVTTSTVPAEFMPSNVETERGELIIEAFPVSYETKEVPTITTDICEMEFAALRAQFDAPTTICTADTTIVTNTSINTSEFTQYAWVLRDDTIATTKDLSYIFSQAGTDTLTLHLTDGNDTDSYQQILTIYPHASELDLPDQLLVCTSYPTISANLPNMAFYNWEYEGELVSNQEELVVSESGWYYLSVIDQCGNAAADSVEVMLTDCSGVYPGDTNNDGVVDFRDVLPLGLAFNQTGIARTDQTTTWDAKTIENWPTSFTDPIHNGLNHKYGDTNGDGVINLADTLAIIENYGYVHGHNTSSSDFVAYGEQAFQLIPAITAIENKKLRTSFQFRSTTTKDNPNRIKGIVFTLNYIGSDAVLQWNPDLGIRNQDYIVLTHLDESNRRVNVGLVFLNSRSVPNDDAFSFGCIITTIDDVPVSDIIPFENIFVMDESGTEIPLEPQEAIFEATGYPIPESTDANPVWIKNVAGIDVENESSNNGGYQDYTQKIFTTYADSTYTLQLTPEFRGDAEQVYWSIWIDYNQNENFDNSELVWQDSSNGAITATFTVPTSALSGDTRLRISMKRNEYPRPEETLVDGEVEDYTVHITNPTILINLNVLLAGAYQSSTGLMRTDLATKNLIPLQQPYHQAPWNYNGTEGVMAIPNHVVDWIIVQIIDAQDGTTVIEQKAALLLSDGRIVAANDLNVGIGFSQINVGTDYYIAIRHRNHLPVRSANPITILADGNTNYDFTTGVNQAFGTNSQRVMGGRSALWAGDANSNCEVRYNGSSNDKNAVLSAVGLMTPNKVLGNVYHAADVNLDGDVKYNGSSNDKNEILKNVGLLTPSEVISCPF